MNTRDKINQLLREYKKSLVNVVDGKATIEQQENTCRILDELSFYNTRLLIIGNKTEYKTNALSKVGL